MEKNTIKNLILLKITKDQELKVEVSNDILLDFTYSNQIYLDKIDKILGYKNSIKKIFVVQKRN